MKKIRYCCKNFKKGTKEVYKSIKGDYPKIKQKKRDCLGNCKLCSKVCFAVVGKSKKLVSAPNAEMLFKKLKNKIS